MRQQIQIWFLDTKYNLISHKENSLTNLQAKFFLVLEFREGFSGRQN
jgi:hypothetical protein